ncbi:MAG: MATE family efflux transporter [Eubacteriales bacterium]|nr:MATE family efflux transporter [Eubacteriales bacterium]
MKKHTLTEGSMVLGLISFIMPLILGQFLQQLYNVADAWVVGNFADNASFAAVSSGGNLSFLIVGFFMGLSTGAGVIIARFYGAKDEENLRKAIHTTVLFGIVASILMTILTTMLIPKILILMKTPESVLPLSIEYFHIYCLGISTIIMYNMFMAIMRALGDSIRPLIFLCVSSVINIGLDLFLVAVFKMGVYGAALATVIAQGISAFLCFITMQRGEERLRIHLNQLRIHGKILQKIVMQGLPAGIQYSALSIGNLVVQSHVNSFGEYAMAGLGAHAKIEGFVFIPIMSVSTALATFVSQNIGAKQWDRMKKGTILSLGVTIILAQCLGFVLYHAEPIFIRFFTDSPESIRYGAMFATRVTFFYFALSFTHAASGIMQGMSRSMTAMVTMLSSWCIIRILYVTIALKIRHEFSLICWAYPITWCITTAIFLTVLIRAFRKPQELIAA